MTEPTKPRGNYKTIARCQRLVQTKGSCQIVPNIPRGQAKTNQTKGSGHANQTKESCQSKPNQGVRPKQSKPRSHAKAKQTKGSGQSKPNQGVRPKQTKPWGQAKPNQTKGSCQSKPNQGVRPKQTKPRGLIEQSNGLKVIGKLDTKSELYQLRTIWTDGIQVHASGLRGWNLHSSPGLQVHGTIGKKCNFLKTFFYIIFPHVFLVFST